MDAFQRRKPTAPRMRALVNTWRTRPGPVARSSRTACDGAAVHLEPAAAWIEALRKRGQTHVFYPATRLGRLLRVGRDQTNALAGMLAQRGEWSIAYDADGTRYARILPKVAP
jgi:hypothetical protein